MPGICQSETVQHQGIIRIKTLSVLAEAGMFHLVFGDPTHKIHNTHLGKCWQTKGRAGTLVLPSNSGRKRVTILGFINAVSMQFSSLVTESNADFYSNEIAHRELRSAYPDNKEIIVIQDNAKYNHAFANSDVAKELNITAFFLPSYSPNLNIIERLWKFMKKKIMKNTYYPTFSLFWEAIISFCKNLSLYKKETEKILSQNFQILKAV